MGVVVGFVPEQIKIYMEAFLSTDIDERNKACIFVNRLDNGLSHIADEAMKACEACYSIRCYYSTKNRSEQGHCRDVADKLTIVISTSRMLGRDILFGNRNLVGIGSRALYDTLCRLAGHLNANEILYDKHTEEQQEALKKMRAFSEGVVEGFNQLVLPDYTISQKNLKIPTLYDVLLSIRIP